MKISIYFHRIVSKKSVFQVFHFWPIHPRIQWTSNIHTTNRSVLTISDFWFFGLQRMKSSLNSKKSKFLPNFNRKQRKVNGNQWDSKKNNNFNETAKLWRIQHIHQWTNAPNTLKMCLWSHLSPTRAIVQSSVVFYGAIMWWLQLFIGLYHGEMMSCVSTFIMKTSKLASNITNDKHW